MNHSGNASGMQLEQNLAAAKKKKICYGIIGFLIVLGVILAIVLPLTLKKKDDPEPTPPTPQPENPISPFDWQEYDPYVVDDSKTESTVFSS